SPLLPTPSSPPLRALLSLPTRRSSDLAVLFATALRRLTARLDSGHATVVGSRLSSILASASHPAVSGGIRSAGENGRKPGTHHRSEEHTSELQSLAYLVCRLLLEKKKH